MLSWLVLSVVGGGDARAGTFEATLDAAREQIVAGDLTLAAGYVRAAELYAPSAGDVLAGAQLARIWMYRGMLVHKQEPDSALVLQLWRQALAVDPELTWDASAYPDRGAQTLFEALRAEVRARPQRDAQVPEATGAALLFVDGQRVRSGGTVREGLHLIQVQCPEEQGVFGQWEDFSGRVRWLGLCPAPVDTSVVLADEGGEGEDEFGAFGPSFGGPVAEPGPPAQPLPPAALPPPRARVSLPLLATAGVAALVSGSMYAAALTNRRQFDDLEDPALQSPEEVEALRRQTNTRVYIAAGSGAAALGLYTAAFIDIDFAF